MDESHVAEGDGEIESHDTRSEDKIESQTTSEIQADRRSEGENEFHTTDMSQALRCNLTQNNLEDLFESLINDEARDLLKNLEKAWKIDEPLTSLVVQKSLSLPAAIVVLAKSLECITHQNASKLSPEQEKVLMEVLSPCEAASSASRCNPILQLAYQLLETDDTFKNAIVDCFWHSLDFFTRCGCIHYNELITLWILEGYFDPVRSVKKAYKDGHAILVELVNRGILKIREGEMIVPEMAMDNLIDLRDLGHLGRSQLGFASVYGGDKKKGLGEITQIDDMIKTVEGKKQVNICTMLVSGSRLRRETPKEFFERPQMKNLEVLGLFNPTLKYLNHSLRELEQLRVLVIRDYDLLPSMEEIKGLRRLEVLEVSGARCVETISDDFFESASQIQSLNLSGLGIKFLPSTISQLKYLHSLILRDCYLLEDLPDIQHLDRLEVIDVREARKLRTCFGMEGNTSRNQTFSRLQRLLLLDFSESKLKQLPVFHDTAVAAKPNSLTRLSLHNCSSLVELPNLKSLSGLQVLDLSGTTSLVEITKECFEQKKELKILNLSGTKITKLPSTISQLSNLSQLLLMDSSNITVLPDIEGLTSLEIFDVSGCTKLHTIEGSFMDMSYLRKVDLSGTRIETLPGLPEKSSIYGPKLVVLANSRRLIHDTWSQVQESITNEMSESLNSSGAVNRIQELSEKESAGRVDELQAFHCPEEKGRHWEHFYQNRIYMEVYMNTIPFVDTKIHREILNIQGSSGLDQDTQTLAKAEFLAFVENSSTTISSIFNSLKRVKGCWLNMCEDMQSLFCGVNEERLGNLETLSITNLRLLDSINSSSFKNLKELSLDCCPSMKNLFPKSASPTSLEVLKIKFCVKLERVFEEEVELPNLHTLCLFELPELSAIGAKLPNLVTYKEEKCPKLISLTEYLKTGNNSNEILLDQDNKNDQAQ